MANILQYVANHVGACGIYGVLERLTKTLTALSLHLYTVEGSIHSFLGGFDIYASEPLTPSCFLFKQ